MSKRNFFTLKQHFQTADELAIIEALLRRINDKCMFYYNKSTPLVKTIRKFTANGGYLSQLQSDLDNEFHKLIDEDTWKDLNKEGEGHIYYNLRKRLVKDTRGNIESEQAEEIREKFVRCFTNTDIKSSTRVHITKIAKGSHGNIS